MFVCIKGIKEMKEEKECKNYEKAKNKVFEFREVQRKMYTSGYRYIYPRQINIFFLHFSQEYKKLTTTHCCSEICD